MLHKMEQEEQDLLLRVLNNKNIPFPEYKFLRDEKTTHMKKIGVGGSGVVYACTSPSNENMAVKVLGFQLPPITEPEEIRTSQNEFRIQMEVAKRCSKILRIEDAQIIAACYDEDDHLLGLRHYKEIPSQIENGWRLFLLILMERLEPIINLREKPIPRLREYKEEEVLKLALDIADALRTGHTQERIIIHRDVKPANIFWDEENHTYKLGDFGIARTTQTGTASTISRTPAYSAPEMEVGKRYDGIKIDIYSYGMTLYQIMNQWKLPDWEVRYQEEILPNPCNGSPKLQEIVKKACAFRPEDRYDSMEELITDLEALISLKEQEASVEEVETEEVETEEAETEEAETEEIEIEEDNTEQTKTKNPIPVIEAEPLAGAARKKRPKSNLEYENWRNKFGKITGIFGIGALFFALTMMGIVWGKGFYLDHGAWQSYVAIGLSLVSALGTTILYKKGSVATDAYPLSIYFEVFVSSKFNYRVYEGIHTALRIGLPVLFGFQIYCCFVLEGYWMCIFMAVSMLLCSYGVQWVVSISALISLLISVWREAFCGLNLAESLSGVLLLLAVVGVLALLCCMSEKESQPSLISYKAVFILPVIVIVSGILIWFLNLMGVSQIPDLLKQMHMIWVGILSLVAGEAWVMCYVSNAWPYEKKQNK